MAQIKLGRRGWLESNYRDLQKFRNQHPRHIQIKPEKDLTAFNVSIAGTGHYQNHHLTIHCLYPLPSQPPRFELLNTAEIGGLNHPHIRDIYICLKAPWTPNSPISTVLGAICQAWWRPTR